MARFNLKRVTRGLFLLFLIIFIILYKNTLKEKANTLLKTDKLVKPLITTIFDQTQQQGLLEDYSNVEYLNVSLLNQNRSFILIKKAETKNPQFHSYADLNNEELKAIFNILYTNNGILIDVRLLKILQLSNLKPSNNTGIIYNKNNMFSNAFQGYLNYSFLTFGISVDSFNQFNKVSQFQLKIKLNWLRKFYQRK